MLKLIAGNPVKKRVEMLIVPVCENRGIEGNNDVAELVKAAKGFKEFSGANGEMLVVHHMDGTNAVRVLFAGMGKLGSLTTESFRKSIGKAVKQGIDTKVATVAVAVPDVNKIKIDSRAMLAAMMEGACLSNYIFDSYLEEKKKHPLKQIEFVADKRSASRNSMLAEHALTICKGTCLARDWVSMPSNKKTPGVFAGFIDNLFKSSPVKVMLYDEKHLEEMGFGAMLGVAKGSSEKPFLAVCDYNPQQNGKTVVLVGKGVTYDSGGINLKTAEGLAGMKMDMGGAATVMGAMHAIAGLKPDARVVGIIPLVENMPSGSALKPGDILTGYNGKTIEIGNTDAEGRLILADSMAWAVDEYKPDVMIDFATLTGACIMALGEKIAGVFSNDSKLAHAIVNSAGRTGERCWQMPMPEDYKELLKSDFADISNMASGKWGGAITAALFLSEFAKGVKWSHIDIAGPVYAAKGHEYCPPGGTGFGVRLVCDFLLTNYPVGG